MAMSMFVAPLGLMPRTVPGRGLSAPAALIAKPEIVEDPAFEVYANLPSGVTAFQQLAVPSVGTLVLIGTKVPSAPTEYEEIADAFAAPGPVSDTSAAPLGANVTANAPGPALAVSLIAESVPSASTRKASIWLVARSVTSSTRPSGLKAIEADATPLPLSRRTELLMGFSLPSSLT